MARVFIPLIALLAHGCSQKSGNHLACLAEESRMTTRGVVAAVSLAWILMGCPTRTVYYADGGGTGGASAGLGGAAGQAGPAGHGGAGTGGSAGTRTAGSGRGGLGGRAPWAGTGGPDVSPTPEAPSDCVVDEGETVRGSRTETDANGKSRSVRKQSHCSLSANCIREQGRETPGDAAVAIDCKGGRCVCVFELFAPHRKRIKFDVTAEDPCEGDDGLKRLLFEHCLLEGRQRTTSSRDQHAGQH